MTAAQFDHFITLVEMDQRAQHLNIQCQTLEQEKTSLKEHLRTLEQTLESAHIQVKTIQKSVDGLELELAAIDSKLRETQLKITRAATPREYFSLEQEITTLQVQKTKHEDELFALWQTRDQAQEQYRQLLQELPQKQENLHKQLAIIGEQAYICARELENYKEQRVHYMRDVDSVLLEQYTQMLGHTNNPVVVVANDSCSACFYPVSKLDLAALKQHELVTCKNCYRLLYIPTSVYAES